MTQGITPAPSTAASPIPVQSGPSPFTPQPTQSGLLPPADAPTWADQLEAWSTLAAAVVALITAAATIWLLRHQLTETRRARAEAQQERDWAARDREQASAERREAEQLQARAVLLDSVEVVEGRHPDRRVDTVRAKLTNHSVGPILDVTLYYRIVQTTGKSTRYRIGHEAALGPTEELQADHRIHVEATDIAAAYIVAHFTDMAGRVWGRLSGGQPLPPSQADTHAAGKIVDMLTDP
jgi:hypothetical protein